MGSAEITAFLTHLAVDRNVAASTQNPCTEPAKVRPSAPSSFSTPGDRNRPGTRRCRSRQETQAAAHRPDQGGGQVGHRRLIRIVLPG